MHKQDIIAKLARNTALDETESKRVLNMVLSEISTALKRGKRVTLTGFGTFEVRKRKKRTSHNINTGGPMTIPAHKTVGFIVGAPLKKLVK